MIPLSELDRRFTYHPPKEDQPQIYQNLRNLAREFAIEIFMACPDSRERSIAFTKLEEVVFWANASIARDT